MKSLLIFFCFLIGSYCYGEDRLYETYDTYRPYGKQERLYNEAEYYYKLKNLYKANKNTPTAPTIEQLKRWNDSRLPHKLTQQEYSNGTLNWPEFFLIGQQEEIVIIDRAMAGEMSFFDKMTVRASILPLESRLYEYRHLLTGNEKIRYRKFLEGLRAHQFYMEK